ncbi:hypothetical protein AHF37_01974 [Paragonimus kellicotti]|nr:hypothetical protein AHF37_01974 [Paragonimus kellicotti]
MSIRCDYRVQFFSPYLNKDCPQYTVITYLCFDQIRCIHAYLQYQYAHSPNPFSTRDSLAFEISSTLFRLITNQNQRIPVLSTQLYCWSFCHIRTHWFQHTGPSVQCVSTIQWDRRSLSVITSCLLSQTLVQRRPLCLPSRGYVGRFSQRRIPFTNS